MDALTRRGAALLACGLCLGAALPARAQDGSAPPALTLFLGAGPAAVSAAGAAGEGELGARLLVDMGAVVPLGFGGTGLAGAARAGWGGAAGPELGAWAGVRTSFGRDAVQTFADLALAFRARPDFTLGPRVAFGAQVALSPGWALYGAAGVQLGLLGGLRADLELTGGVAAFFELVRG